ncbi:MAG: methylthioribulose 1-phosphate dehydratase [Gammaproteobacteria bacterium]|nr:methylthioribulose 1-phosphate dehydratase [Gammaproteobacteria bacterium]
MSYETAVEALIDVGGRLHDRGWLPATSGNLSVRLGDGSIAITVSGAHKGGLRESDLMRVNGEGRAIDDHRRPSAETLLHTQIYATFPEVGVVLHTHSVNATVISRLLGRSWEIDDLEILKAFPGIDTHESRVSVPVFDNDQDMVRLAGEVERHLHDGPPGYLIRGHGLYAWGADMDAAVRHLEAFEFLLQCELLTREVTRS